MISESKNPTSLLFFSTGMSRHPPAPEIPTFYPLSPGGVGQITPPLGW